MSDPFMATFLNWIVLHVAGLIASLSILNLFLRRRHSYAVWAVYFGVRAVIRSYASALIVTGKMTPALMNIDLAFIVVTAVLNFVVLYYVWGDDPLKLCAIGLLSDIVCGTSMVLGTYIVNIVTGNGLDPYMHEFNLLNSIIDFIVIISVVRIMTYFMKPVAAWFQNYEFKHRKLVAAAIIIGVSLFSSTNVTDNAGFNNSTVMVCLVNSLMLLPVGIYAIKMVHSQRDRKVLLRQQAAMTSAYILAVDRQSESVIAYGDLLDTVREKIDSSEQNLKQEQLRKYVSELRDQADQLRNGKYSSSFVLDAELSTFAGRFEAAGYTVDFRADNLADVGVEQRASEITWILLNWVLQALETPSAVKSGKDMPASTGKTTEQDIELKEPVQTYKSEKTDRQDTKGRTDTTDRQDTKGRTDTTDRKDTTDKNIRYSIMSSGNQIIFSLKVHGMRGRHFPERLLREHIGRGDFVSQTSSRDSMEIDIMKEENAWEL